MHCVSNETGKAGESLATLELVLLGQVGLSGKVFEGLASMSLPWLQCHFHDFPVNRTLVHTYLNTSPAFHVRVLAPRDQGIKRFALTLPNMNQKAVHMNIIMW